MKSILNRSIIIGITLSSLLTLVLMTIFFVTFPFNEWGDLWEKKVFELPFVVFVLAVTFIVGASLGITVGLFWKKQVMLIEQGIEALPDGNKPLMKQASTSFQEIESVVERLTEVQRYIREQTKRTQQLVDERVEDQQEQMEKVVSEERNRLARELHDSVSQELFAASMMVSAINETITSDDVTTKRLKQVESMIQQAQLEMRALLLHLRPIALKDKSLKEGMQQLLEELKQKVPLDVNWKMEQVNVSRGVEDHLFRILQESVSNTLRHAKATTIDILLMERDQYVILRIIDDGVGFDVEESLTRSYGIGNMKERASEMGAKLRIISVPNEGTRLEVRVPIIEVEGDDHD